MSLLVTFNNPANDPAGKSIINGQGFSVTVTYEGTLTETTITVYAFDLSNGEGFVIGSGTIIANDPATISCIPVYGVEGNSSTRALSIEDTAGDRVLQNVPFWFEVDSSLECAYEGGNCGPNTGYSNCNTACNNTTYPQFTEFVALPSGKACNASLYVVDRNSGSRVQVPVYDVGPVNTTDNYWNNQNDNGAVPLYKYGLDSSEGVMKTFGVSYSCGSSSTIAYGSYPSRWRFV